MQAPQEAEDHTGEAQARFERAIATRLLNAIKFGDAIEAIAEVTCLAAFTKHNVGEATAHALTILFPRVQHMR